MIRAELTELPCRRAAVARFALPVRALAAAVLVLISVTVAVTVARGCGIGERVAASGDEGAISDAAIFDITGAAQYATAEGAEGDSRGFCSGNALVEAGELYISAKSAVLCTEGGRLIYGRNASERMPMASITKVMTAIVVLESVSDISVTVEVPCDAVGIEGSSIYLGAGDKITVRDLLYALLLASANDSAVALAIYIGQDESSFVEMMNTKAAQLGMDDTCFKDPHGLSCDGHYTTARDYARLMAYALKNKALMEIMGARRATLLVNGAPRPVVNHNRLLYSCPGMLGGKTGYTVASGRTLVTACKRNGITLICVTLNASDDWNDHRRMYDVGFSHLRITTFSISELAAQVSVTGSDKGAIRVLPASDISVISADGEEVEIRCFYRRFLYAPVYPGDAVGRAVVYINGVTFGEVAIEAADVAEMKGEVQKGALSRLRELFGLKK